MAPVSSTVRSTLVAATALATLGLAVIPASIPAAAEDTTVGAIKIEAPWLRATPTGAKVAGGYMKLYNLGKEPDRLVGGSSQVARGLEVHEMHMDGSVMKMRELSEGLEIPPGQSVELRPGSYHLMLTDLLQPLKEGERIKATLQFANAGRVEVLFTVRGMASMGPGTGGSGPHGGKH
jgi:copper(I)-binding protein